MISATPGSLGTESLLPFDPRASQAPVQAAAPAVRDSASPAAPVRPLGDVLSITGENLPQKPEEILTTLAQLSERAGAGTSEEIQSLQKFLKASAFSAESAESFAPALKKLVEGEQATGARGAAPKSFMNEVARLAQDIDQAAQAHAPANHVQDLIARAAHSLVEGMAEPEVHASNQAVVAQQTAFARADSPSATYAQLENAGFTAPAAPAGTAPAADANASVPQRDGAASEAPAAAKPEANAAVRTEEESTTAAQARAANETGRNAVQAAPATASEARAPERPEASSGPGLAKTANARPDTKSQPNAVQARSDQPGTRSDAARAQPESSSADAPARASGQDRSAGTEPAGSRDAGRSHAPEGRAAEVRSNAPGPQRMPEASGAGGKSAPMDAAQSAPPAAVDGASVEGAARMTAQAGSVTNSEVAGARAQPTSSWTGVLPLEIGGKLAPARLALEWTKPPEQGKDGDGKAGPPAAARPVSVALDLASEDVGHLSVRMTWLNNELVGVFLADRPEMVALAEQRIGDLETRLDGVAGKATFRVGGIAGGST